jgi:hypothetical protein
VVYESYEGLWFSIGPRHPEGSVAPKFVIFHARIIYGDLIKEETRLHHN